MILVEAGTLPLDAIGRPATSTGMRPGRCGGVDLCGGGWDRGNGDVQRNGEGDAGGNLLVALFLKRELEELGVTMDNKKEVHAMVAKLVSPDVPNHLSDDGVREFNKYAHAGFEVLLDWFPADKPRTLETFLRTFKNKVGESVGV